MKNNSAAKAQNQKGNQLRREGKLEQAIACYQKAIEINPQLALSYFNLGQALVDQEKFDDAVQAYRKAIEINPKPPKFHQGLKDALQQKKPALKQEKINKIKAKALDLSEVIKKFNSLKYRGQLLQDKWVVMMTQGKQKGVFLEIGSSDGVKLNNTFCLEKKFSWSGMCVEPNPDFFKKLCANRTAITLPYAFSKESGEIVEFINHDVLGTIAKYSSADGHAANRENFISEHGTIKVLTARPDLILELYKFPENFDFLSLDVEGAELEVLESFNLSKWHPALACIEHNYIQDRRFAIFQLLSLYGYKCLENDFDDWYYHPEILKILNPDIPVSYYEEVTEYFCQNHQGKLIKWESFKGDKKNKLIIALAKFIEPQEFNNSELELFEDGEVRIAYLVAKKFNLQWENLKDFQIYELLGENLTNKGELEGAIACYQKTLELQPELWGVYQKLADIYWQQKQLSTAVATLEKAIELNPDFSWFYHKLGVILLELQQSQKAAITLEKAIKLNPDFYPSYEKLGEALSKLENWSAAVATYQNAGNIKALSYWGENKLGEALMKLDKFEEAIAAFNRAIEIKPNLYLAHHNLGDALSKLKRWDEAIAEYQKAIEINPNSYWSYRNLGSAAVNLERWKEAVEVYRKVMEINPNDGEIIVELRKVLKSKQKLEREVKARRRALKKNPKSSIIAAGIPRSGSTMMYQVLAALFPGVNITKTHDFVKKNNAKIVVTYRDFRDVAVSLIRVIRSEKQQPYRTKELGVVESWEPLPTFNKHEDKATRQELESALRTVLSRIEALDNYNNLALSSKRVLLMRYELFFQDYEYIFQQLSDFFEVNIDETTKLKIIEATSVESNLKIASKLPDFSYYDPESLIHGEHIYDGKVGGWVRLINPEDYDLVYELLGDALGRYNYI